MKHNMLSLIAVAMEVVRSPATSRLTLSRGTNLAVVMCASLSGVVHALNPVVRD
jgi:hypothetical protein